MRIRNLKGAALALLALAGTAVLQQGAIAQETVGPVLSQPGMNIFRRFSSDDPIPLFDFYAKVLGHESLTTYDVGGGTGVSTFRAGAGPSQLKFTGDTRESVAGTPESSDDTPESAEKRPGRQYQPGGIDNATGIRLWTFFYSDQQALTRRFTDNGYPAPEFVPIADTGQLSAVVRDPEGELVQLIITGDPAGTTYSEIEVGLTVSDLEKSRAFYREFVGLEELEPVWDPIFRTMKYPYRHGSTTISLRHFGDGLPADTGTGGIQYVVSDVDLVDRLARERGVVIDQPLNVLQGFALRTIWLDDPDGITNYFAQTGAPRTSAR